MSGPFLVSHVRIVQSTVSDRLLAVPLPAGTAWGPSTAGPAPRAARTASQKRRAVVPTVRTSATCDRDLLLPPTGCCSPSRNEHRRRHWPRFLGHVNRPAPPSTGSWPGREHEVRASASATGGTAPRGPHRHPKLLTLSELTSRSGPVWPPRLSLKQTPCLRRLSCDVALSKPQRQGHCYVDPWAPHQVPLRGSRASLWQLVSGWCSGLCPGAGREARRLPHSSPRGGEDKVPGVRVTQHRVQCQANLGITFRRPSLSVLSLFLGASSSSASPVGS